MGRMKWVCFAAAVFMVSGCCIFRGDCFPPQEKVYNETNSFIIKLGNNENRNNEIKDDLKASGYRIVKQCNCSPDILLYGVPPGTAIDPVEKVKGGLAKVTPEEGGFNINVFLPISREIVKPLRDISTPVLAQSAGSNDLKVAIIDTGIDYNVAGLSTSKLSRSAVANGNCEGYPVPGAGFRFIDEHGTKVALAFQRSLLGTNFENPDQLTVKFLDLQIFDRNRKASLFDAFCAIRHAIDKDVDAVVMSWGFYKINYPEGSDDDKYQQAAINLFRELLEELNQVGIPMVAAAGNGKIVIGEDNLSEEVRSVDIDTEPFYPASFARDIPMLISVGALSDPPNAIAEYSNTGNENVTVYADDKVEFEDVTAEGTSYAAPKVAVAAAVFHKTVTPHILGTTGSNPNYAIRLRQLQEGRYPGFERIIYPKPSSTNSNPRD